MGEYSPLVLPSSRPTPIYAHLLGVFRFRRLWILSNWPCRTSCKAIIPWVDAISCKPATTCSRRCDHGVSCHLNCGRRETVPVEHDHLCPSNRNECSMLEVSMD